ncbi:nucleotide-binding universal stress UspA family protein [Streptacidiphilus sp. MAP12-16]|uniref:universal stress protein n=1 Tax=Streptacidiphilus sp. MAP12-16 TaxID=3156300 RepID=UPI0035162DB4
MTVLVWITEGTWQAAVDAARTHIPTGTDITLLHVIGDDIAEAAHGAFVGLLGRGRPGRDPRDQVADRSERAAAALLDAAADRLGRPATRLQAHGRTEREVVHAAAGADLLICARDGDPQHLGPRSLGPATRFVVDHAPCPILLVWPEPAPSLDSLPPHPPHP